MSAYDWYAIRLRPQHRLEFQVLHALTQREHAAMVPFETRWEKRKNSRGMVAEQRYPIFPCYIFAQFCTYRDFWLSKEAINQRAIDIGKHPPIVGLVGYGSKPAKLSRTDVSMLQAISLPRMSEVSLYKAIRAGERASIVARGHPFQGHDVTVNEVTRTKCTVLLNMLGSMRVIEIDASALEAA
jgi:transcription antitermination factor NusG